MNVESNFRNGIAAALLIFSIAAAAHHGTAGSYDQNRWVTVSGVVKEFRWRNPHSAIFIVGKDESGKEVAFAIETGSPNVLVKQGYTRHLMKAGDEVSLQMHPGLGNWTNGESLSLRGLTVNGKQIKPVEAEPESP